MEWLSLVLILIGIGLLVAEIFIPSFGVTGILGIAAIVAGVVMTAETLGQGVMLFLVILVLVMILMFIAYRFVAARKTPLILQETLNEDKGGGDLAYYLNKKGVALTILRPAGKGDFDGVRLDVMTEGGFIKKGSAIVVSRIEGKKMFVRELTEED